MKKVCGNLAYEKEIATIKKITKTTKKKILNWKMQV